ncbi:FAD/NAD(P)-binding protein [Arenibaculum sp.]|jgi:uncharacterized NAD(P)/FAD-binding protein YdhS|uniref:FAD/NAD(P)-binding protein n=1 Tax=Arenibaculum sp. TaxID=2865862 RepID=UPI002E0FF48F|nr:FAD/NAD(P)-binding protein [Arenibaculum sp.]
MMRIAIVGLGPWGLCVLDRIVARMLRGEHAGPVRVDVFEPATPGAGVHAPDLPDYLLLNTPCGQVSLFGDAPPSDGVEQLDFFAWCRRSGHQVAEPGPTAGARHLRPVEPNDFLPRRLLGGYLEWVYGQLLRRAPADLRIVLHPVEAVDVVPDPEGGELVLAEDGRAVGADCVFLTIGHTAPGAGAYPEGFLAPYPTTRLDERVGAGGTVAIAGMGLVAVDVLTALTTGRGGAFVRRSPGGRLRYVAGGAEPRIALFSRNGSLFRCRPATGLDRAAPYRPIIVTDEAVRAVLAADRGDGVDLHRSVMPMLCAEMRAVHAERHVLLAEGEAAAHDLRDRLRAAWDAGLFEQAVEAAEAGYGRYDPRRRCFGVHEERCADSAAYQDAMVGLLAEDLADCGRGEAASPRKAADEMLRVLRNAIRACVDYGRLDPSSHGDFYGRIASMINRVIVGPPLRRGEELMALIDAGIVSMPFGSAPRLLRDHARGGWRVDSTTLAEPASWAVDHVVAGYLPPPLVEDTSSRLIAALRDSGRVRAFTNRGAHAAGIDVGEHAHCIRRDGTIEPGLLALGPLVEGARYFNHYIPSPGSRRRAFEDAEACVGRLFSRAAAPHQHRSTA